MPHKRKLLNGVALIVSLFGYLEWGKDNHAFLFQAELELLSKLFTDFNSALHPFTIIPLAGQLLLLITLFQKVPSRILSLTGIAFIGILLFFILIVGLISLNFKIIISTLPFLIISFFIIRNK